MEAIIKENIREQIFQLPLRTMTKAVMEENRIVKTVALTVMMVELANTLPKFIFFIASGKFFRVKPWAPISARGFEVISALLLNTLMITRTKGKIKQRNIISRMIHMIARDIFFCRAAFSFSSIMRPPLLSYQP